jgi:LysR family nod box-dependent transcriptional activator
MHVFDEWFLEREGFKRRLEVVCMTFNLLPLLVVGTTRIATVPERFALSYSGQFSLKVLPTPIDIPPLYEVAQWHKYQQKDTAINWLRRVLCDLAQEMGAPGSSPAV